MNNCTIKRIFYKLIKVIILTLLTSTIIFPNSIADEYELKAAFIEKFARFIEWPPESILPESDSFEIVILGENPFGNKLAKLYEKQKIKNKPVKIRYTKQINDIGECQILFICPSMSANVESILTKISKNSILTIGQTEGFCEKGVHINFYLSNSKLKFQINEKAARISNLKISHLLLQNATLIDFSGDKK